MPTLKLPGQTTRTFQAKTAATYPGTTGSGVGQFPVTQTINQAPTVIPGYTPDYNALVEQYSGPFKASQSAMSIADAAARAAATQKSLIDFGEVPGEFPGLSQDYLNQDITQNTRDLASQNTTAGLSQVARLAKQHSDNIKAIKNMLASRGALRSGELGYQLGEEQKNLTTGQYDSRKTLLEYLAGVQAAFLQGERQRQGSLSEYLQSLMSQLQSAYPTIADQYQENAPDEGVHVGGGWYVGQGGNVYNDQGQQTGTIPGVAYVHPVAGSPQVPKAPLGVPKPKPAPAKKKNSSSAAQARQRAKIGF